MKPRNGRVVISSSCALLCAGLAYGQGRGGNDWATSGNDPQRSSWVRTDAKISPAGLEKPGFAFLWKQKLASDPHGLNSLTEAVLMERYIGYRGFRSYAHLATSGDTIVALDTDLGRIEWKQSIGTAGSSGTSACPGGLTAIPARATSAAFPTPQAGRRMPRRAVAGAGADSSACRLFSTRSRAMESCTPCMFRMANSPTPRSR